MGPTLVFASILAATAPLAVMALAVPLALAVRNPRRLWPLQHALTGLAALAAVASLVLHGLGWAPPAAVLPGLRADLGAAWIALLVQGLGSVIAAFSARYLAGEPGQPRYAAALAAVLAGVHALLLADHWAVLIGAWVLVGAALQRLLCFYPERPFARLAAHKKWLADRLADALLLGAAWLSWQAVGSGSLSALLAHVQTHGAGPALQAAAVLLVLAVIVRTALLPLHGWLIQVMEAPTPVSALLHAGVVNLGGYVLIRFAPLLDVAAPARTLLVVFGTASAVLAGLVMLTRVSIKLRLAWSTLAQMGFMLLECGLGLYTMAMLHLIGHSIYKAHAFLAAGEAVRAARARDRRNPHPPAPASLWTAPAIAAAVVGTVVAGVESVAPGNGWPWWWSGVLAIAWAPLLWRPPSASGTVDAAWTVRGAALIASLTALALAGHALPLGTVDVPHDGAGPWVLGALAGLYAVTAALQHPAWAARLEALRRASYAGFYLDEAYTRAALRLWPARLHHPA